MKNVITFLSDFDQKDWFVGAVKGEILKHNSKARIIDITHAVPPHDIKSAAFIVQSYYKNYPSGTVHLAVVDPGVGSSRKPIIVRSDDYLFVGPDNGIFSYIYTDRSEVFEITSNTSQGSTFHARDIFGLAAALLARGQAPQTFGPRLSEYKHFAFPGITRDGGKVLGQIVYIDRFGNCITNIPHSMDIDELHINGYRVGVKQYYAEGQEGELISVKGSRGFYEIVINGASAAALLDARIGMVVTVLE
jgi:S-adenosylmethionine hydrolase